jgi:hypothetical protein
MQEVLYPVLVALRILRAAINTAFAAPIYMVPEVKRRPTGLIHCRRSANLLLLQRVSSFDKCRCKLFSLRIADVQTDVELPAIDELLVSVEFAAHVAF